MHEHVNCFWTVPATTTVAVAMGRRACSVAGIEAMRVPGPPMRLVALGPKPL